MTHDLPSQFEPEAGTQARDWHASRPTVNLRPRSVNRSNWPVVLSLMMLVGWFVSTSDFGVRIRGLVEQRIRFVLRQPVLIGPARPDVVLVSLRESDRRGVILTVEPRGYRVREARTAEDGLGQLVARGDRVGIVVVDGSLANAARVAHQANLLCPRARLVVLRGPRQADQVAARVLPGTDSSPRLPRAVQTRQPS